MLINCHNCLGFKLAASFGSHFIIPFLLYTIFFFFFFFLLFFFLLLLLLFFFFIFFFIFFFFFPFFFFLLLLLLLMFSTQFCCTARFCSLGVKRHVTYLLCCNCIKDNVDRQTILMPTLLSLRNKVQSLTQSVPL